MNENIPTAEEMRAKYMPHGAINLIGKGLGNGEKQFQYEKDQINSMLVEFAKLHVEAALNAAAMKAKSSIEEYTIDLPPINGKLVKDTRSVVDRKSILNAYPLDNIK